MAFHPYLFFGGTCADAFTRYHEIFGGELQLMRMGDAPGAPDDKADWIIHGALSFPNGGTADLLMASDDPMSETVRPVQGMMVSYAATDADDARAKFDALAEGGTVTQELIETFFSPAFGMCTDRFGIAWMVSAPGPENPTPA
ncbi:VOC family protein [Desertimonas flava]|jgi:PhnB protein|uniref:VOC family protein n=1 Tax=Desertimonas flava TaxID=2064846 RepID=UPI000E34647D|nr:VOC family protein [Desertimonas flava]